MRRSCNNRSLLRLVTMSTEVNDNRTVVWLGFSVFAVLAMTITLAIVFQSSASAWKHTYADNVDRSLMTRAVVHPLLVGTYTTLERATAVTEFLMAVSRFTKPGDGVLAYNGSPLVYFLTETHPWLGISWPDLEVSEKISKLIRYKEQTGAALPFIGRAAASVYDTSWPKVPKPLGIWWRQDESRRVFAEFEKKHGYVVAWSNGFFEILTSPTVTSEARQTTPDSALFNDKNDNARQP